MQGVIMKFSIIKLFLLYIAAFTAAPLFSAAVQKQEAAQQKEAAVVARPPLLQAKTKTMRSQHEVVKTTELYRLGEKIGYLRYTLPYGSRTATFDFLRIHADYQGRHYGKLLLETVRKSIVARGYDCIKLYACPLDYLEDIQKHPDQYLQEEFEKELRNLVCFYTKCGFVVTHMSKGPDKEIDGAYMEWHAPERLMQAAPSSQEKPQPQAKKRRGQDDDQESSAARIKLEAAYSAQEATKAKQEKEEHKGGQGGGGQ
jgi:ribosomal protein S18 acetylase RimI-like enzyme